MDVSSSAHAAEVAAGDRFRFGANWARFLTHLDERRIAAAVSSLQQMLGLQSLAGMRFLDVGSGSGLFSLAASRLGANVDSFDFDPQSVACTAELRRRFPPASGQWTVRQGSVLDRAFLDTLGTADIVYSWGVLHHTGHMYDALANAATLVRPGGKLFIAIYNDQGWRSRYWYYVKRLYNHDVVSRFIVTALHAPVLYLGRVLVRAVTGRLDEARGMSLWHDYIDWMGGYPFEVASVARLREFFEARGFRLENLHDIGDRHGCNELVFVKHTA
jgi:2-polyprenyl-6-hydroxyphenyl methylase/3-demethylubiquinone-9 3-methyltransferase